MKNRDFDSVRNEIISMQPSESQVVHGASVEEVPFIMATANRSMTQLKVVGLPSGDCVISYSDKKKCRADLCKLKTEGLVWSAS